MKITPEAAMTELRRVVGTAPRHVPADKDQILAAAREAGERVYDRTMRGKFKLPQNA